MSKPIQKGDLVEITAMDSKGAWSEKCSRERFLGTLIELINYQNSSQGRGWKYIEFDCPNKGNRICMFAKVRRVKK